MEDRKEDRLERRLACSSPIREDNRSFAIARRGARVQAWYFKEYQPSTLLRHPEKGIKGCRDGPQQDDAS